MDLEKKLFISSINSALAHTADAKKSKDKYFSALYHDALCVAREQEPSADGYISKFRHDNWTIDIISITNHMYTYAERCVIDGEPIDISEKVKEIYEAAIPRIVREMDNLLDEFIENPHNRKEIYNSIGSLGWFCDRCEAITGKNPLPSDFIKRIAYVYEIYQAQHGDLTEELTHTLTDLAEKLYEISGESVPKNLKKNIRAEVTYATSILKNEDN